MPFLSIEFVIFWLFFLPIYWSFGNFPRFQNFLLLVVSWILLGNINLLFLYEIISFSFFIYWVSNRIIQNKSRKKHWLIFGIVISIFHLGFFKYFDFFRADMQRFWQYDIIDVLMPLGVSYYTFQAIAYLISIYHHKNLKLSLFNLLLYLGFFLTITAGPIIRLEEQKSILGRQTGIINQLNIKKSRFMIRPALATSLILLAIIKKWWLVGWLADKLVNPIFENPQQYDVVTVLTAIYGYTVQLFLDFSGYTDLVMGLAMFLGFQLPQNFHFPLISHNIRTFWERWHMTLSAWIRDYIYIPLGGNRVGFVRTQINVMLAMILSGVWHGYGWNFLIWGFLHGLAFILLNISDKKFGHDALSQYSKYTKVLSIFLTFTFVSMSFVVFRTDSLNDARLIFQSLLGGGYGLVVPNLKIISLLILLFLALLLYKKMVAIFNQSVQVLECLPVWLWAIPITLILLFLLIVAPSGIPGFIYANF